MKKITIIGSGLVGSLAALYLAKRGYEVAIYESHSDPRKISVDKTRSINLAMSCRGLTGLAGVGLEDKVKQLMVPMRARAIHELSGLIYQPFGRHEDEYINAIQRIDLNNLLINEIEALSTIELHFNTELTDIDFTNKRLRIKDNTVHDIAYEHIIAADGAGSVVRDCMMKNHMVKSTRTYLAHGYKELSICEKSSGQFAKEHLHLWPRDSFLLLGNPNCDGSITGSLFMAKKGRNSFANLDTELKIHDFFQRTFPDAYDAMPHLIEEIMQHPVGSMSTVHCAPWYYGDQCLLLGDAAHGIVPFFGQGMNCGFEDCRVLNTLLDEYHDDWQKVMPAFFQARKPNTEAVAKMSMDNYHEIHENIREPQFHLKKQVERVLMQRYPELYQSKHVLVMFSNTDYSRALAIGEIQQQLLDSICLNKTKIEDLDWAVIDARMAQYLIDLGKL